MSTTPFADDVYQPQPGEEQPGELFPDMADALDEPDQDALLDSGYSPPERPRVLGRFGTTLAECRQGETLEQRIAQEVPDISADDFGVDPELADHYGQDGDLGESEVGHRRAGRLMASYDGDDVFATDLGIDGGAASAEEAAMHVVDDSEGW